jgi:hypothetical protein
MTQIEPLFIFNRGTYLALLILRRIGTDFRRRDIYQRYFICHNFMSQKFDTITESSSRMYSPFVFAIGQLLGEIPYNILCGILYWVLLVRFIYSWLVDPNLLTFSSGVCSRLW